MTELEMLQAFGQIVDEKMSKALEPLQRDLSDVKADVSSLKNQMASMEARLTSVETRIESMETRLTDLETQVAETRDEVRRVALVQENEVLPKLQLLFENQTKIIDEHREMDRLDTQWRVLKDDVDALKFVVKDNSKEIQRLKKAQ